MSTELRGKIKGRVLLPGDDAFAQAAKPWILTVDQPVAAVAEAADAADVAAVVRYARAAGLTVAAQANGHGASGAVDGVILLRTKALDSVEVDPDKRLARVGAGASWGKLLAEAGPHGLTGLAGSSPIVSVAGFTLGGGQSWFGRKHGWAADSVRAFDVVDAEGEARRVTEESDADLFWALRGGGGDYAVVTALEFDLYPAPDLYGGRVVWHGDRTAEVFAAFRELTAEAPPELSVWFTRGQFPQAPPMAILDLAYLGDAGQAKELLGRLDAIGGAMSDSRAPMAVADLGAITNDPTDPGPGLSRAELLTGLDDKTVDALLGEPIEPLVGLQVRHLGGAFAQPGGGPTGPVAEPYLLYLLGLGLNPELSQAVQAKQGRVVESLGGVVSGRKPYTFLTPGDSVEAAFSSAAIARLREIKRARDPQGVIRANYPV